MNQESGSCAERKSQRSAKGPLERPWQCADFCLSLGENHQKRVVNKPKKSEVLIHVMC